MTTDLRELKSIVEDALDHHLPKQSAIAPELVEAMRYATLSGGKRLRPMMLCSACEAVGGALEDALAPACAVEFIHAYSLIHDDLPAMDDDALRHGLPACHIRFGEAGAILAGDALQTLAFETLAAAPNLTAATRIRTIGLLAGATGWNGMTGGQSFDLSAEGQSLAIDDLRALHSAKTGALIQTAVQMGAIIGCPDLSDERYVLVGEFAARIGHAFQVVDDVLDVTASTQDLGKPAGSDQALGKSTYSGLLGVDGARQYAAELHAEALKFLDRAGLAESRLGELADRAVNRRF